MPSESILDGELLIRLDLSDARALNRAFASDLANAGRLAHDLLLYERVIIPISDFGIVPSLASWLGSGALLDLLRSRSLLFIRRKGLLGYVGNGNGISTLVIHAGPSKSLTWWQEAVFADSPRALELQLANVPSLLREADLILSNVVPFEHANDDFVRNIAAETYTDIMRSPSLSAMVSAATPKRPDGSIDLTWLP